MYLIENEYKRELAARDSALAVMRKNLIAERKAHVAERKAHVVKDKALIAERKAHQKALSENAEIKAKLAELERKYRPN